MLQRKRQQYRKQIRRRQIQKIFQDKRNQLIGEPWYIDQIYTNHEVKSSKGIEEAIQKIIQKIQHEDYQSIAAQFTYLIESLQSSNTETSFSLVKQYQKIAYLLRSLIKNKEKIEQKMQWKKLDSEVQFQLLNQLFKVLSLLNYGLLQDEPYQVLVTSFWLFFTWRQMNLEPSQMKQLFDQSLRIIKQMLNGQHKIVLSSLKAAGLGAQIIKITQNKLKDLSDDNQKDLIQIIFHYIDLEIKFKENDFDNNIHGITIIGLESSQKTHLMAFALYILDIKLEESYLYALKTLIRIFQTHQYLIDSVSEQSITAVCRMIHQDDRKVSLKAIQLLDDIIYHGKAEIYKHILEKTSLLNTLKTQIQKQMKNQDDFSKDIINYVINILCNITLVNRLHKDLIKTIQKHPIWQLCYQNIDMNSPFLELIGVFQYYFDIIGRTKIIQFFEPFLYAVSQLDFNLIGKKQLQSIKMTIARRYSTALQHWEEGYSQKMKQLLAINRLSFIIEEMMEQQQDLIELDPL